MLTDDVLSRLSQLNRGGVPLVAAQPVRRGRPRPPRRRLLSDAVQCDDVSQLPPGCEVVNSWGKHWLRERSLVDLWPHGAAVVESRDGPARSARRRRDDRRPAELQAFLAGLPGKVMLLDLETCGFAGSPIFLVGLLHEQDHGWKLSQLLARNYAEEKSLLQTLWTMAAGKRVLVTFNGKSFDWPMVHDRSTLHHLGQDPRDQTPPGRGRALRRRGHATAAAPRSATCS